MLRPALRSALRSALSSAIRSPATPSDVFNSAEFDGVEDHWLRGAGLTGQADSQQGTLDIVFERIEDGASTKSVFGDDNLQLYLRLNTSNQMTVRARNSSNQPVITWTDAGTLTTADGRTHLVISWDASTTTGAAYRNGAATAAASINDRIMDLAAAGDWALGAQTTGGLKMPMKLHRIAWWPGQYIDLTVPANLAKFYDSGAPVDLGSGGTSPGLGSPIAYWNLNYQSIAQMNAGGQLGTGGDGTMNGSVTDGGPL